MRLAAPVVAAILSLLPFAPPASAAFHLWSIAEAFSTADGKVQFVELVALTGGQEFLSGHTLVALGGASPARSFTFPANLPGDTSGKRLLIGTQSFAASGVVTPDYVVPDGFLATGGGTINFGESADAWTYPALPTDGRLSLDRSGATAVNSPTNFGGKVGSYAPEAAPPDVNVQGLWWRSPANSESGWGVNIVQQGTILFVTWFTFGTDGNGMWLVMSDARRTAANTYSGAIYRVKGPSFDAVPFDPAKVVATQVGSGTFTFSDANNGTFAYNVDNVSQTKPITRLVYSSPVSTCTETP